MTEGPENNRYHPTMERENPYQIESNRFNYLYNNRNNRTTHSNITNITNESKKSNYYNNLSNNNINFLSQSHNMMDSSNINQSYSNNSINNEKGDETINSSYMKGKSKTIESLSNKYFSLVTVENVRKPKDIIYILDNFLTENNYDRDYKTNAEKYKISFVFYNEEIAFNFTKLLNGLKNKNALFTDMNVNLRLKLNNNYNKIGDGRKRRGLSIDSIQRLFQGLGSQKLEKKNKIHAIVNLGVSSPYLLPFEKKRQKNKENTVNTEKLKDYTKLPIRVLDTHYAPLRSHNYRPVVKEKWVCPTNFKF